MDIAVVLSALYHRLSITPDTVFINASLNGQAKDVPDIYSVLEEMVWDFEDKINPQRGIDRLITYLLSSISLLPEHFNAVAVMSKVLRKNTKNRPPRYFSVIDETSNKLLSIEEQLQRFAHSTLILRKLRNVFSSPLPNQVSDFFDQIILDFRNPPTEEIFNQKLQEFRMLMNLEVQKLLVQAESRTPVSYNQLETLLELAGAVSITPL